MRLSGWKLGYLGLCLNINTRMQPLPHSLLPSSRHEVGSFPGCKVPAVLHCLATCPKSTRLSDPLLKRLKLGQNKTFLLQVVYLKCSVAVFWRAGSQNKDRVFIYHFLQKSRTLTSITPKEEAWLS